MLSRRHFVPFTSFVAALLLAAAASAQPRSDTVLTEEITAALEDADLVGGRIEVAVRDGVAMLSGEVRDEAQRARVIEIALFIEGVAAVETDLTVLAPAAAAEPAPPAPDPAEEEPGAGWTDPPAANPAAAAPAVARRPDGDVLRQVQREIEDVDLDAGSPAVTVEDGVVRLVGQVANAWEWGRIVERAEAVPGVVAVDPDLEVAEPESQEELIDGVRSAVLRYAYYSVFDDINFGLEGEYDVVLLGAVTEPFKKTEIEERVSKVFGVRSVDNRIEVLPLSPNDQDLRRALYFRIYRDPRFADRASRVNPPIHIIVSRGVVALTGFVRSPVESRILESIARSTPGVFRVVNRLQH